MPTHIYLRTNCQLFLMLTHWSYSKCKYMLPKLNVDKIPAKKHQVVDRWAADEISVLEILFSKYLEYVLLILRNYKKLKRTNFFRFTISSFFKCPIRLSDNSNIIFIKRKKCLLKIRVLYKFLCRAQNMSP